MSCRHVQTLQYRVTPPQAFATPGTHLPTGFPLESALAANLSQVTHGPAQRKPVLGQEHGPRQAGNAASVENRKALQYNLKSAARRGGTFLFGRARRLKGRDNGKYRAQTTKRFERLKL
jgi:hypothetical protein